MALTLLRKSCSAYQLQRKNCLKAMHFQTTEKDQFMHRLGIRTNKTRSGSRKTQSKGRLSGSGDLEKTSHVKQTTEHTSKTQGKVQYIDIQDKLGNIWLFKAHLRSWPFAISSAQLSSVMLLFRPLGKNIELVLNWKAEKQKGGLKLLQCPVWRPAQK